MNCMICGAHLIWRGDIDMLEDTEGEIELSSSYDCPNDKCGVWYDISYPNKEIDNETTGQ